MFRLPPESQSLLLAARARIHAEQLLAARAPPDASARARMAAESDRARGRAILRAPLLSPPDDDPDL